MQQVFSPVKIHRLEKMHSYFTVKILFQGLDQSNEPTLFFMQNYTGVYSELISIKS